jgi:proline iminopeptidase
MKHIVQLSHCILDNQINHTVYPLTAPFNVGMLPVSPIHSLHYATYGNPVGIPVIVLHGGPGAGCHDGMSSFFDLSKWFVIMFDQRGAGRSTPLAMMEENTPQNSISDMELIRTHFGIDQWLVFGGSWGSTLGILYGQAHPERCLGFILRGIFLAREFDASHLVYEMGKTFPEAYQEMLDFFPIEEQDDLVSAFYKRIMDSDPEVQLSAGRAFMKFDLVSSTLLPDPEGVRALLENDRVVLSVTRAFFHYARNKFFLGENQILADLDKIAHLPAMIVHGRWDVITPLEMGFALYQKWGNSRLQIIPLGGHSTVESPVAMTLASASDEFARLLTDK